MRKLTGFQYVTPFGHIYIYIFIITSRLAATKGGMNNIYDSVSNIERRRVTWNVYGILVERTLLKRLI